jgi:glycosyltransferase involved in cell wall biosynthesis
MLQSNIFENVVFVGIDYKVPRGGIASVLNTYSTFIHPFKFVRTTAGELNGVQKYWYAASGYVLLIWKLLTDSSIEIVHIHSASGSSFWRKSIAIKIAKSMGKKVIFHCHGGGFKEFRDSSPAKVDAILNKVDSVVCLSSEWKTYFESIGCKNVVIIKNVIVEPEIATTESDGLVHFLFLGLICDNKGIFDSLEAIAKHKDELLGKVILHIGGNGQTERLTERINELGLEQLVRFEGWVNKEKKRHLLNLADVYILPSYIEGVPISILEAESYHKPVITTNVGGIPSIVRNNETGLFVTPGNQDEIYQSIKTLTDDEALRKRLGEAGYEISKGYLPETIKQGLENLYSNILNDNALR